MGPPIRLPPIFAPRPADANFCRRPCVRCKVLRDVARRIFLAGDGEVKARPNLLAEVAVFLIGGAAKAPMSG